jgi:arginyl-tRNA synthetase
VERTRDAANGDFATNIAMRLAKVARKPPRELAEAIVKALQQDAAVEKVEIAGSGFINFFLARDAHASVVRRIHELGDAFGRNGSGANRKVLVEFVSSNPTGPLHVGHGRHGAYGASVANLLEANGYAVHREYYINDAGRQVDIIAVSVWLRYLEVCGEEFAFPANGYKGDYVREIAAELLQQAGQMLVRPEGQIFGNLPADEPEGGNKETYIDAVIGRARELIGDADFRDISQLALKIIIKDMEDDLREFGVVYDRWYSEASLSTNGAIDRALERLRKQDHVYEKDGALWFRATAFGDEKDRVVVRENGVKTYFASDIAYHLDKRERGFEILLDILGSDHHGYTARVRAGLAAMGEPADSAGSAAGAVRVAVSGRREGGHVHARRRVHHAAAAARRGGQRRGAILLRDAQPRPAAGFRPGAGQEPQQRQPGVLHPVRPCARGQRAAADGGQGACLRQGRGPGEPRHAVGFA